MASEDIRQLAAEIAQRRSVVTDITMGMEGEIVGQHHLVESLVVGLLTGGHILLEGVPGLAKTKAIRTLSGLVGGSFSRIQFTPDLLPADVTGTLIYSARQERFETKRGPVFANFVLADEINRAPAKVQSALLEAMEEHQVTIGDETLALPAPFLVMATQNPLEQEGTYALPEAQVDRFMLKVLISYPTLEEEKRIVREQSCAGMPATQSAGHTDSVPRSAVSLERVMEARSLVARIYVDERLEHYICSLVQATRTPEEYGLGELKPYISYGSSPRGSLSLARAARARAFMGGRGYVVPEDVREVAHDVLRHRVGLTYEAEADGVSGDQVVEKVLEKVAVP